MFYDLQRASMWKRISAWMFDVILLGIVAVLFAWGMSTALGMDGYQQTLDLATERYSQEYGVNLNLTLAEYDALSAEEIVRLNEAYAAMSADEDAVHAYNILIRLMLIVTSLSILLGYAVMEFAIPMRLGNGQTLGKKIFGLALMQHDGVRVNGRVMFVRTFLGKFAMETMVPVLIVMMIWFGFLGLIGTLVLFGILLVEVLMVLLTKSHLAIHDVLATTLTVDFASQLIFADKEAMIAYKKKIHAQKVSREAE